MSYWKKIGDMIRLHRTDQGLTQSELGEMIGATKQFISNLENGRQKCSIDRLADLAGALGCYLDIELTPK